MFSQSIRRLGCAVIGTLALGIIYPGEATSADFCTDLKSAFAQSGDFGRVRGASVRDRVWASKLNVSGGNPCELYLNKEGTSFSLVCTMSKGATQASANTLLENLKTQVKSCFPAPPFTYKTEEQEGQFASKSFWFNDYEHGQNGLVVMNDQSAFAMPGEKQSAWLVTVSIFGR
jgi:hypothetical protein